MRPCGRYELLVYRRAEHPKAHLAGFGGWMHTDGYAGFGKLARAGPVREVACLAHVRRKFFDVHAARGSAIAAEALERIAALYAIEKEARGQPPDRRVAIRGAKAGPRLDDLERWLQTAKNPAGGGHPVCADPPEAPTAISGARLPGNRQQPRRVRHEWPLCLGMRNIGEGGEDQAHLGGLVPTPRYHLPLRILGDGHQQFRDQDFFSRIFAVAVCIDLAPEILCALKGFARELRFYPDSVQRIVGQCRHSQKNKGCHRRKAKHRMPTFQLVQRYSPGLAGLVALAAIRAFTASRPNPSTPWKSRIAPLLPPAMTAAVANVPNDNAPEYPPVLAKTTDKTSNWPQTQITYDAVVSQDVV